MMNFRYLTIVAALFAISVLCKLPEIPSSSIPTYPIILINLYHPQNSKCKEALPQLIELYELPAKRTYEVAQINCGQQTKFCESLKPTYPAIFLFVEGNPILYEGELTAEKLHNWMQSLIHFEFVKIDSKTFEQKQGKQAFVLIGGLNSTQKIQVAATKLSRYIGIEFYEIQSANTVFTLYVTDQDKKYNLAFPVNTTNFAYQLFHRTRDHILDINKPEYLDYFRKQKESDEIFILYDHHDQFSTDATPVLDKICFRFVLDIICYRVEKQSQFYGELVGNFKPLKDRSSIIYNKRGMKKAYLYQDQQFSQKSYKKFLNQAREDKRNPDFQQGKEANHKTKSQNVLTLDTNTHKQIIQNNQIVLIEYYSPVLKSCSNFVPQYDAVGKHFRQIESPIIIASLNADQYSAIAAQQQVSKFPAFKVFIDGEGFNYEGKHTTEAIIDYLLRLSNVKLQAVSEITDVQRPSVVISGITPDSLLHKLPAIFSSLPIFEVADPSFRITLLKQNGQVQNFTRKSSLAQIVDWLQEQTGPILVSLGDSNVPKKLKVAMKKFKPILGLIDKGKQGSINSSIQLLKNYCQNKKDIICGIAKKGEADYKHLVNWIGDSDQKENRLVWIDFKQLKSHLYEGDLASLDEKKIDNFINGILSRTNKKQKQTGTEVEGERQGQTDIKSMANQQKQASKQAANQL